MANVSPPVKWIGSKTRLAKHITALIPTTLVYHEPFLGGGAVFLEHINSKFPAENYYLSDINDNLINVWLSIQNNCDELCAILEELENYYHKNDDFDRKKSVYLSWRNELSDAKDIRQAAVFLALTKTSFNGLVRYNKKGLFNAAFGEDKNRRGKRGKFGIENIYSLNKILRNSNVVFQTQDFTSSLSKCQEKDFVYLDPPYYETNRHIDKLSYSKNGFAIFDHYRLFGCLRDLGSAKVKWLMSNHYCDRIVQEVELANGNYSFLSLKKMFAGNANNRIETKEILAKNY